MIQTLVFYFFATVALFSASMMIVAKHPVRSALWLILTFLTTGAIWLLLEAEFLAITLILVYVGAVMVLFLFVIFMLDIPDIDKQRVICGKNRLIYLLASGLFATLFLLLLVYLFRAEMNKVTTHLPHSADYSNVAELGKLLFTRYLLNFEIAGVLLLVGIVAAIGLTWRGVQERKTQDPSLQLKASKQDRLQIVKGM